MFFSTGTPRERADRLLDILSAFDDKDACQKYAEDAAWSTDPEGQAISESYAQLITLIRTAAEAQSLSGILQLPDVLAVNASCLEEALGVLSAAIRDGVSYADTVPDWRREFLATLPRDGSYRSVSPNEKETSPLPAPPDGHRISLTTGLVLVQKNGRHWVTNAEDTLCGPGRTAIRIAEPRYRGKGYGAVHCAVERLLNLSAPQSQSALTPGGYASRSFAWDILANEMQSLGIETSPKGGVPVFEELEAVLNDEGMSYGPC